MCLRGNKAHINSSFICEWVNILDVGYMKFFNVNAGVKNGTGLKVFLEFKERYSKPYVCNEVCLINNAGFNCIYVIIIYVLYSYASGS